MAATLDFMQNYSGRYELYVSPMVLAEISRTSDPLHRRRLEQAIRVASVSLLPESLREEVERLAAVYLASSVIPRTQLADAIHVAYATAHEMDILLSWNFKHLANMSREARIQAVNRSEGYRKPLRICSPLEVMGDDEE